MIERKIRFLALFAPLTILGLMWAVFLFDYYLDLNLYRFGVFPLKAEGLVGVIASPFLHNTNDFAHIINNSFPTLILGWLLFYHYRTIATKSFVLIYLLSGISLWILGRESYHIGMSGVIYGLTSFLVFSGFYRKNMRVAAVSLFVIFLYGSMVWGIFPLREQVSWEAHALGLFSGIITSVVFRSSGPQPSKLRYEIEEELGIEPDHDLWKGEPQDPPKQESRIIINYEMVPKNPEIQQEEE